MITMITMIVKRCKDLPGAELFQYLDDAGKRHCIDSQDVNNYLHEITQQNFSAKDFRTWAGSVCALDALKEALPCFSENEMKHSVTTAVKSVAQRLGNTPAVCCIHYIHPIVLESFMEKCLQSLCKKTSRHRNLLDAERMLMDLLR